MANLMLTSFRGRTRAGIYPGERTAERQIVKGAHGSFHRCALS